MKWPPLPGRVTTEFQRQNLHTEPMQRADTNFISPVITTSSLAYQVQKEHPNLHLLAKAAQGA